MISFTEAKKTILEAVHPVEAVSLRFHKARKLFLAENIIADENVPSFHNSAMDGFAVHSEDVNIVPVDLKISGEISAGNVLESELRRGEAMAIFTGAKIPLGCDAVVQQEWTENTDNMTVKILRTVQPRQNVRFAGEDIPKGEVVLCKGQQLHAAEIGVLASLGKIHVRVYRPLRVAILSTGNELVNIDEEVRDGKIRNSNEFVLEAMLRENNCGVVNLGIANDAIDELQSKISEGLNYDVCITSGGVSVGKYDLVEETLRERGVEIIFSGVNIKPGKPFLFGLYHSKPVFGLPGNPVSAMMTFLQFIKPALLKMQGSICSKYALRNTLNAVMKNAYQKNDTKRHFVRGIVENNNGTLVVRTFENQSSNALSSMVKANCFVIIPENVQHARIGESVEVEML